MKLNWVHHHFGQTLFQFNLELNGRWKGWSAAFQVFLDQRVELQWFGLNPVGTAESEQLRNQFFALPAFGLIQILVAFVRIYAGKPGQIEKSPE